MSKKKPVSHLLPTEMRSDGIRIPKLQGCFAYRQEKLKVVQHMLGWEDTRSEY